MKEEVDFLLLVCQIVLERIPYISLNFSSQ